MGLDIKATIRKKLDENNLFKVSVKKIAGILTVAFKDVNEWIIPDIGGQRSEKGKKKKDKWKFTNNVVHVSRGEKRAVKI